jgi:hypothetical protein
VNRDKAVRYGFGEILRNAITYDGNAIKIYDAVTTNEVLNENLYVLLTRQTAANDHNLRQFRWRCIQTIEIVSKQISSVSKDIADEVSEQIEQLIIYPNGKPGIGNMAQQSGWKFEIQILESVDYTEFELETNLYEITKILQFSCIVTKL